MSNLKCPVCGKDMVFIESDEGFDVFVCTNSKCKCCGYANESVWKYIDRTCKALEIIKKEMSKETMPDFAVIRDALKGVSDE